MNNKVFLTKDISPGNNEKCVIQLSDGSRAIAWQKFGIWQDVLTGKEYDSVIAWRYFTDDDARDISAVLKMRFGK